jgi:hypothetical protein
MGFLENLRRQNLEEKEATRKFAQERELEDGQKEQEREIIKQRVEKAREHFNQSGVVDLIKELENLGKIHEIEITNPSSALGISAKDINVYNTYAVISGYSGHNGLPYRYICISARVDGTIVFKGTKEEAVSKAKWNEDRDILEEALGRAYYEPEIYKYPSQPQDGM